MQSYIKKWKLYPDIMGHTLKLFPESVQNTNYFSYLCRQDEDI